MAEAKVKLEKLNDENYDVWKFKMELLLTKEDLLSVVEEEPPTVTATAAAAVATEQAAVAAWKIKDGKACAMIGLAVEDDQLVHIIRKKNAKEMWDSFAKMYEESLQTALRVLRKLCSLRLSEGGNLPDHLNLMTALHNRLEMMNEGLKDRFFMALILSSLLESYGSLINVIENKLDGVLTVDFVKSKLRDE